MEKISYLEFFIKLLSKKYKYAIVGVLFLLLVLVLRFVLYNSMFSPYEQGIQTVTFLLIFLERTHTLFYDDENIRFDETFLFFIIQGISIVLMMYNVGVFFDGTYNFFPMMSSIIIVLLFLWKWVFNEYEEDRRTKNRLYLYYNYAIVSFFTVTILLGEMKDIYPSSFSSWDFSVTKT